MQLAASPSPSTISANERLLAGFAHVGAVFGPFLVVPVVIYFLQRDKSRFVAYHAACAIKLFLGVLFLIAVGLVAGIMLVMGLRSLMSPTVVMALLVGAYGFISLSCLIYLVLAVLAAVRAFTGEMDCGLGFMKSRGTPVNPMR